jgi:glutamyl-tRNA reductase
MTTYLADRLPEHGFTVALSNRTMVRAEAFAESRGIEVLPLERLQRDPEGFDALVTATSSPEPLFTLNAWAGLAKHRPLRRARTLAHRSLVQAQRPGTPILKLGAS